MTKTRNYILAGIILGWPGTAELIVFGQVSSAMFGLSLMFGGALIMVAAADAAICKVLRILAKAHQ